MEERAQAAEALIAHSTGQEALDHAIHAAQLYYEALGQATNKSEASRLKKKLQQLLAYGEKLKKDIKAQRSPSDEILQEASKLLRNYFPPWTAEPHQANFELPESGDFFTDRAEFSLSSAQVENFAGWVRPTQLFLSNESHTDGELLMAARAPCDLVQDITTDCSVVAGLSAAINVLTKTHSILSSMIYPYDHSKKCPKLSPSGKYILRLNFNGCHRQVVIDDRLPASKTNRKLFVVDQANPELLWPALLEKAYLKVRGGYDFPGSNSGTDLWVLTGWIPEQIFLSKEDLDINEVWTRIKASHDKGDVVITIGTGCISVEEEEATGLIGEHDYAIQSLDDTNGSRKLLVKNPWCSGPVWRGSWFSTNPTGQGVEMVDKNASGNTNIWVTLEDVQHNFESMYLNWNPGLFAHRQDHHFAWEMPPNLLKSTLLRNPQFSITSPSGGSIWVLVNRHFVDAELEIIRSPTDTMAAVSRRLGYMSILVFDAGGRRVQVAEGDTYRGPYVDSPQTLARLDVSAGKKYTVVIDQQEFPLSRYTFTLSVFSHSPAHVEEAIEPLAQAKELSGSWTRRTAGGNAACSTYFTNPQYELRVHKSGPLSVLLSTDSPDVPLHVDLLWTDGKRVRRVASKDLVTSSGEYRRGCALVRPTHVDAGRYTLVCSTYEPGQTAEFRLRVTAAFPIAVEPIPATDAGRMRVSSGPLFVSDREPRIQASVIASRLSRANACISVTSDNGSRRAPNILIRLSVVRGWGPDQVVIAETGEGEFQELVAVLETPSFDLNPGVIHHEGMCLVVEGMGMYDSSQEFQVELLSDSPLQLGSWQSF